MSDRAIYIICLACPILLVIFLTLSYWLESRQSGAIVLMLMGIIIIRLLIKGEIK